MFVSDQDTVNMVRRRETEIQTNHLVFVFCQVFKLLFEEGFFVGASSGLNVAAAVLLSQSMPKGSTIVTCICDNGQVGQKKNN